ncbi:MAG: 3-dehydroquinate synthase [Chloroflexota bacterium]|nr:3-dehydroquinate synthase [Chloroflexota bacterium]
MSAWRRVVLIGFSGGGKSTAGRLVAERLGWEPRDIDSMVERRFGMSVPEVFARHGEAVFREAERAALVEALWGERVVIATGGGAPCDDAAWSGDLLGRPGTLTVALDAGPAVLLDRLRAQAGSEGDAAGRPMLAGDDPLARIIALKAARQPWYDRAALTLVVDRVTVDEVAAELVRIVSGEPWTVKVAAPSGSSEVVIGSGVTTTVGARVRAAFPAAHRSWVITDAGVAPHALAPVEASLAGAGLAVGSRVVAAGEGSKSLAGASDIYDWLLGNRVERGDVVVALGGGVVGDLAGFVAATTLRGLGLVQVPTSLLAMVDSSVGGKTGVNHPAGKNLIGAFNQPALVVIDPALLATMPPRQRRSGWAEIVKHAVIQPSTPGGERADLARVLTRNLTALATGTEPALGYVIARNVALKAAVVEADEREAGLRAFLNFGHTIGHAIEAAGYTLLHGEAVAVGTRAAARLGHRLGTCDAATVATIDHLLDAFDLPRTAEADLDRVHHLIGSDKKRAAGQQSWVLPLTEGGVVIRRDVPETDVRAVIAEVVTPAG